MKITNHLESVKRIFIDYPRLYELKQEEFKQVSSERQDLLHVLELGKLDAIKMGKITRDLKQVQIKRRQIKDNLEVLDEIKRFINQFENKHVNKNKVINNSIERIERITNRERVYNMRVRKDLQDLIK